MAKPIKSPFFNKEKETQITLKIQKAIEKENINSCFVFMLPNDKTLDAIIFSRALCGHQLLKLANVITERAEKMIEQESDDEHNED